MDKLLPALSILALGAMLCCGCAGTVTETDAATSAADTASESETAQNTATGFEFALPEVWAAVGQSLEIRGSVVPLDADITFDGGDLVSCDGTSVTGLKSGSGTLYARGSGGQVVAEIPLRVIDYEKDETVLFTVPVWGYEMWRAEQMELIAAAGIDLIQSAPISQKNAIKMLTIADEYGVGVLCSLQFSDDEDAASLSKATIIERLELFSQYPAFKGINIVDEPSQPMSYVKVEKIIHGFNPELIYTTNFLPNQPESDVESYAKAIKDVGEYICFDRYPFLPQANSIDETGIFREFELYRDISRKYGLHFGFYIQAVGSNTYGYRRPDEGTLNYNCSAGLAYGAAHFRYFSYFTPNTAFTNGIIDSDMKPTELYDSIIPLMSQLHYLGYTTINADAVEVYHIGRENSSYTLLPEDYFVQPAKRAFAIVSHLTSEDGREYLMFVNKSFTAEQTMTFTFKGLSSIAEVSPENGLLRDAAYTDGELTVTLAPGGRALYLVTIDEQ